MKTLYFAAVAGVLGVSNAQVIQGNYTGPLRPQVHFSPPQVRPGDLLFLPSHVIDRPFSFS